MVTFNNTYSRKCKLSLLYVKENANTNLDQLHPLHTLGTNCDEGRTLWWPRRYSESPRLGASGRMRWAARQLSLWVEDKRQREASQGHGAVSQIATEGRNPHYSPPSPPLAGVNCLLGLFLNKVLTETTQITIGSGTFFNTEGIMMIYSSESLWWYEKKSLMPATSWLCHV